MPTTLELISYEKIAGVISLISSLQAIAYAFEAERAELEKQQNTTSPESTAATVNANKLALDSTWTGILSSLIYLVVAIVRKNQLEKEIQANITKTSILPNIYVITGFIVSILGALIRIPAIQQRLLEAQRPVFL